MSRQAGYQRPTREMTATLGEGEDYDPEYWYLLWSDSKCGSGTFGRGVNTRVRGEAFTILVRKENRLQRKSEWRRLVGVRVALL